MDFFVIIIGIIFSLFSSLVLSYISMATMVGPWMAPTLVLFGNLLYSLMHKEPSNKSATLAKLQAIGAGGGIIATGIGFAFPMLYFLDPTTFADWLAHPWYFGAILTSLCITAGGIGLVAARWFWPSTFNNEKQYPFPVSQLTYSTITSQSQTKQSKQLLWSISATSALCFLRDGMGKISGFIPRSIGIFPAILPASISFAIWPTLWAIGFSVGLSITIPLVIGMFSKYFVVAPLLAHASYLPWTFFDTSNKITFTFAFCSGIMVYEALIGIYGSLKKNIGKIKNNSLKNQSPFLSRTFLVHVKKDALLVICLLLGTTILLHHLDFPLMLQTTMLLFVLIATFYICQFGGKIGMIPFGRFSTFVLIPLLLLFNVNAIQATIVCVFFNICAATASDLLFDYHTGRLTDIQERKMFGYQWIGLIATAFGISLFLWLLFTHFQLGSEALCAQRAQAKALLIQSLNFDKIVVGLGMLYGYILKKCKVNTAMVFGGIIMPESITLGLTVGSLATLLVKNKESWLAYPAGVLAAESLWVIISIGMR